MTNRYQDELEISEHSYKQAVLSVKILEAAGNSRELVDSLERQAESCLTSEVSSKRTFGLHLLRFLYKKGRYRFAGCYGGAFADS
jgi:hypothetical protein